MLEEKPQCDQVGGSQNRRVLLNNEMTVVIESKTMIVIHSECLIKIL